jgi:hypothetical protein
MSSKGEKSTEERKKRSSSQESSEKHKKSSSSSAHSSDGTQGVGNVIVVCRFRPLNQNELNHGGSAV